MEVLRDQAANLLIACYAHHGRDRFVRLAGVPLAAGIVAAAAAVEIAVHGWDVSAARGPAEEIPPGLAARMLRLCPLLVPSRDGLFAPPVAVPPGAPRETGWSPISAATPLPADPCRKRARHAAGAPDPSLARAVTKVGVVGAGLRPRRSPCCSRGGWRCRWS